MLAASISRRQKSVEYTPNRPPLLVPRVANLDARSHKERKFLALRHERVGKFVAFFVDNGGDCIVHLLAFSAVSFALPCEMEWGFTLGITAAAFAIGGNLRPCGFIARKCELSFKLDESGF